MITLPSSYGIIKMTIGFFLTERREGMKKRLLSWILAGVMTLSGAMAVCGGELLSDGAEEGFLSGGLIQEEYDIPEELLAEPAAAEQEEAVLNAEDTDAGYAEESAEDLSIEEAAEEITDGEAAPDGYEENDNEDLSEDINIAAHQLLLAEAEENGTAVVTAAEGKAEPVTNMYETSWKALAKKIMTDGKRDGKEYILNFPDTNIAGVVHKTYVKYTEGTDHFEYYCRFTSVSSTFTIWTDMDAKSPDKVMVYFTDQCSDPEGWIRGTGEIEKSNRYRGGLYDLIQFKKTGSGGTAPCTDAQLPALASIHTAACFNIWNDNLKAAAGLTLNQLHFHSFGLDEVQETHDDTTYTIQKMTFEKDGWTGNKCNICGQISNLQKIPKPEKITLSQTVFIYDGKDKKPTVKMTRADNLLIPDTWYDVKYPASCSAVGTYNLTITLKGEYAEGSVVLFYEITDKMDLTPPKLISAANETAGVRVKWEKVKGAASYRVYRKDSKSGWKLVGSTPSTDFLDKSDLVSGTTYYYTVRAADPDNSLGDYDKTGKSTIWLTTPLTTHAFNVTAGINVRWSEVKGAYSYRIYRRTNSTGYTKVGVVNGDVLNYKDTDVKDGEEYIYTVRAGRSGILSDYYRTGKMCVRLPISRVYRLDNNAGGIGIKWADVGYVQGYKVLQKDGNDWKEIKEVAGTVSYYTDAATKTAYNKYYTYSVRGYTKTSRGDLCLAAFSTIGKTIFRLAPSTLKTVTNNAAGKATLNWSAVAYATGYEIEYSSASSFSGAKTLKVNGQATTSQTITGLTKGLTYYFRVRSRKLESKADYYGVYSNIKNVKITN